MPWKWTLAELQDPGLDKHTAKDPSVRYGRTPESTPKVLIPIWIKYWAFWVKSLKSGWIKKFVVKSVIRKLEVKRPGPNHRLDKNWGTTVVQRDSWIPSLLLILVYNFFYLNKQPISGGSQSFQTSAQENIWGYQSSQKMEEIGCKYSDGEECDEVPD